MPRDRAGTFEPRIVPKHQRRLSGFDEAVISLYAKGMTTGDIAAHLEEVYDTTISCDLVQGGRHGKQPGFRARRANPGQLIKRCTACTDWAVCTLRTLT